MTNLLHAIFSSSNLSGLHVKLEDGFITAKGNMSLDQHSLQYSNSSGHGLFNYNGINMSSKISDEVTRLHNGELFIKDGVFESTLRPESLLFKETNGDKISTGQMNTFSIEYKVTNRNDDLTDGLYLDLTDGLFIENKNANTEINVSTGGLFVKNQNSSCRIVHDEITLNDLSLTNSQLNVSTSNFSLVNKGTVAIEGNGLHLNTSSRGLSLSGSDIINTSSGGYVNKFLRVYIYEDEQYKPYNIPLMNVWSAV